MDAGVVAGLLHSRVASKAFLQGISWALKAWRAKGRPPQAVAAARGRLRRRRSSPMRPGIAFVAAPCIQPRGARNAAHTLFQQPATRGTSQTVEEPLPPPGVYPSAA
jgi:hypothetical protein